VWVCVFVGPCLSGIHPIFCVLPCTWRRETHTRILLRSGQTHTPQQWECKPPPCIGDIRVRDSRRTTVWLSGVAATPDGAWCLHAVSPQPLCKSKRWSQKAAWRSVPGTTEPIRDTTACRRKGLAVPVPIRAAVRSQGCPVPLGCIFW